MKSKNISQQSGELLAHFNKMNKPCFTTQEATTVVKSNNPKALSQLLSDMAKRGLLMKIKQGIYYIIPYEQNPESFMPDWHLLAQYIVGDAEYYIGYYSAMQIHSLITQPALREQIVVNKQIKPSLLLIKNIPFQFIYHNTEHFFGSKKTWIDNHNKIFCADLEKTIIDGLFKPQYSGGITEIAKALYKSKDKINFQKLAEYTIKFDSLAVSKRLGYLLELLQINQPLVHSLQQLKSKSHFLLEPSSPRQGKIISRWNLQENIDKQSILSPLFS